jgi:hypothetical protein
LLLENRNGVLIDFAKSVCDLSSVQMSSDQLREARASAEEGVSAYADLASAYPLAFCAKLGGAIASLKGALERGGAALHDNEVLMRAEALASTTCLDRVD